MELTRDFSEIGLEDVDLVGGKNASLGEMVSELSSLGVRVPGGFAITAQAYRHFVEANGLEEPIREAIGEIGEGDTDGLSRASQRVRRLFLDAGFPSQMREEILTGYRRLSQGSGDGEVAVRSSATAEDLPEASFAGQQESFLNVNGEERVLESVKECFASLFTARAISYREDMGFDHFQVELSVGVQKMVRADLASSGVLFTLDTETGFPDVVYINSAWGLGENIVGGKVTPDQFYVHKPTLEEGYKPLIRKQTGAKKTRLVYDESARGEVKDVPVPEEERDRLSLEDEEVLQLARWAIAVEDHYSERNGRQTFVDMEWAKDGRTGELYVLQARPETVHGGGENTKIRLYNLMESGEVLLEGLAVGEAISSGEVRVMEDSGELESFQEGEVLVTEITDPDWEPIMKKASAIVAERGGRTSHAAIVARELGIPAVLGAEGARESLETGQPVTICCAEGETGRVYKGELDYEVEEIDPSQISRPETSVMINVGNPEQAFSLARLPNDGVGLARMEFVFAGWVGVHPLALTRYESLPTETKEEVASLTGGYEDKTDYFVDKLSQGIGTLAAAFWPQPVVLRFSDFKTNEYANLLGGAPFEPDEENPMLGWRGASRYYHPEYKEGFLLEVEAVKRVRQDFGLKNLKVMVPFCRTPEEGRKVLEVMEEGGLVRGEDGLEVYVMAELPSNVLLAEQFARIFDGFSIGSNDLTQLVLGVDRDSQELGQLFEERDEGVKSMCDKLIEAAHAVGRKVGICGQAPSDYPDFAEFLVERGIDSISLSPDAVPATTMRVVELEKGRGQSPTGG